jgi:hypothetical protein
MKFLLLVITLLPIFGFSQTQKKWYDTYWIGANTSVHTGSGYLDVGYGLNAGKKIKDYRIGLDYQVLEFTAPSKAKIISIYLDKSIKDKKRELFFYALPGLAYPLNTGMQISDISNRFEYKGKDPGFNFQLGTGIRWNVKRHSYYLSSGFSFTKFKLKATEYPIAINPYNPFIENGIVHTYTKQYNKVQVKFGFNL